MPLPFAWLHEYIGGMMISLSLKPTHKPVKAYYDAHREVGKLGVKHEGMSAPPSKLFSNTVPARLAAHWFPSTN